MNPGATNIVPPPSTIRVAAVVIFFTSALDPTAAIRSPRTATASAHGRRASPVHTRALTIASVTGSLVRLAPDEELRFIEQAVATSAIETTSALWRIMGSYSGRHPEIDHGAAEGAEVHLRALRGSVVAFAVE